MAMGLFSHVALSHYAFPTSLVDFHTLYDQPFGPSARRVFIISERRSCTKINEIGVAIHRKCNVQDTM